MNQTAKRRILVVGATGMLGAPVARRLVRDGFFVRVLARDQRKAETMSGGTMEVVQGDVTRKETLPAAVAGCDGMYVSLRGNFDSDDYAAVEGQGLSDLLSAGRDHGLSRVALISGAGQTAGNESLLPVRIKLNAEHLVQASGIPWTIFRCTHFMESLDLFVRGRKATIIGHQPHAYHYIAAEDYAAMVSRAFETEAAANRVFTILGPESFTMAEALQVYIRELAPELKLGRVPAWLLRLVGTLTGNQELRFLTQLFASFTRVGESGDPGPANRLLGTPSMTLMQWCQARRSNAQGQRS
jgi:uncharacterized protein YbjT (DUF2867 family)